MLKRLPSIVVLLKRSEISQNGQLRIGRKGSPLVPRLCRVGNYSFRPSAPRQVP
jgi:hypothetical protein